MRRILSVLTAAALATAAPAAAQRLSSDSAVLALLKERVAIGRNPGIVVGLVDAGGRRVVAWGSAGKSEVALDGRTEFEVGSITKVFTAALLADAVARDELTLDDPVAKLLPASVKVPDYHGREITLVDLATHSSGLPRLPTNLRPANPANPYADYTVQQLYDFLSGYQLTRAPGERYEYSNLGAGLLGHALALRAGKSYEALLRERVLRPLGMDQTGIALGVIETAHLAQGHNDQGRPVPGWDIPILAGAGALRSNATDMMKFVAANLAPPRSGLPALFAMMRRPRLNVSPTLAVGLAYHIDSRYGHPIVWHNGGTGGFHSFVGYDTAAGVGVVVLSNSAMSVDDIGFHLLDAHYALMPPTPPEAHQEISLERAILQRYVGIYDLTPSFNISITLEPEGLWVAATDQPRVRLLPESETEFFIREAEVSCSFVRDSTGQVTGLVLHQGGRDQPATRRRATTGTL